MNDNRRWNRLDSPEAGRMALRVVLGICVMTVVAGLFFRPHGHYRWEAWVAFYGVYGFLSYLFLVLVARELRKLVMRDEEYYDRSDE